MKETFYYELNGQKFEYHLKDNVPFADILNAIDSAVNSCYTEDGAFHPELEDFYREYVILKTLTDIDMPVDADGVYGIIRAIDGVPSVDADFIADGIRQRVNYQTRLIVASLQSSGSNRLADEFGGLLMNVNAVVAKLSAMVDKVAEQADKGELADISKLIDFVEKMNINPETLASAMVSANRATKKPARTAKKAAKEQISE